MEKGRLFLDVIGKISTLTYLLPVLVLAVVNAYRKPLYLWLCVVLFFSFACETIGHVIMAFYRINSITVYAYNLLCMITFSGFFAAAYGQSLRAIPFVALNIVSFGLAFVSLALYLYSNLTELNYYTIVFQCLCVIVLCLGYFFRLLKNTPTQPITSIPLFWIIAGIFVSNVANLVVYTFAPYLVYVLGDDMVNVWIFQSLFSIIGNLVILLGSFIYARQLRIVPSR